MRTLDHTPRRAVPPPARPSEAGMVLVTALLILALLSVLTVAGIATSTMEVKIAAHDRNAKQAFYLCEAGIEKAKFEVINGWGQGDGLATATAFHYTFTFRPDTLPDAVKAAWGTADDKWQNFTLLDSRGFQYTIKANDGTSGATYEITDCGGTSVLPPRSGRASLYYQGSYVVPSASGSGTPGVGTMTISGALPETWTGYWLRDGAGNVLDIQDQSYVPTPSPDGTTTLSLSGTPATGGFEILDARVAANGTDLELAPRVPNAVWTDPNFGTRSWYLVYPRTSPTPDIVLPIDHAAAGSYGRHVLTFATGSPTPRNEDFELTVSPWLADVAHRTPNYVDYSTGGGTPDFPTPSGTDYGTVRVAVTADDQGRLGRYRLVAVSTSALTGDAKELQIDATVGDGGVVQFSDWRQVR